MNIFDFFNKKRKQKQVEQENSKSFKKEQKPQQAQSTSNHNTPPADNSRLNHVNKDCIINGTFVIPDNIKTIGALAFWGLKDLKTVVFHKNIKYISNIAFKNCESLKEVLGLESAENMKSINGFENCTNLQNITLPPNLEMIGESAFFNCKELRNITIPESCWSISDNAFAGCSNLEHLEIPANMEIICTGAFTKCKNLVLTFMEDNEKYLEDIIKKHKDESNNSDTLSNKYFDDEQLSNNQDYLDENPDLKTLYEDLDIKHNIIQFGDKEITWACSRIIIQPNAIKDVKEVITCNEHTLKEIIKSGYKGKITYFDKESNQVITLNLKDIEEKQSQSDDNSLEK